MLTVTKVHKKHYAIGHGGEGGGVVCKHIILYGMGEAGVWRGAKSYPIIIEWALKALKFAKVLKVDESIPNDKIFRNQNYRIILMSVDTEYIFQKLWKILPIGIFFCSMMCSYCNLWSTQLCLIVI